MRRDTRCATTKRFIDKSSVILSELAPMPARVRCPSRVGSQSAADGRPGSRDRSGSAVTCFRGHLTSPIDDRSPVPPGGEGTS